MKILGSKVKEKELPEGQFFCPTCDVTREYQLKQSTNRFNFFFRIQNLGERFECRVCGSVFEPEVLELENQRMMKLDAMARQALLTGATRRCIREKLIASGAKEQEVDTIIRIAQTWPARPGSI
jgi:rubredoxin